MTNQLVLTSIWLEPSSMDGTDGPNMQVIKMTGTLLWCYTIKKNQETQIGGVLEPWMSGQDQATFTLPHILSASTDVITSMLSKTLVMEVTLLIGFLFTTVMITKHLPPKHTSDSRLIAEKPNSLSTFYIWLKTLVTLNSPKIHGTMLSTDKWLISLSFPDLELIFPVFRTTILSCTN